MVAAHMDEIGFYVKYIDDKGFLRLQTLGGFDPRQLFAQRVLVHTRRGESLRGVLSYTTKPAHMLSPEEAKETAKIENFFVDVGLPAQDTCRRDRQRGCSRVVKGQITTVSKYRFIASRLMTTTGRVFAISPPKVGSSTAT